MLRKVVCQEVSRDFSPFSKKPHLKSKTQKKGVKVKKGCTIKISIQDTSQSYTTSPAAPFIKSKKWEEI